MLSCFLFYFCDTISQILHITFNIGNIRFDVCNIPFNLGNIPFYLRYSIIGCFQLTTIHCICRGTSNFTSSHTTNFAALINGNPIVDCYSTILVKFYRGLVIRNSISSDIHICQFSSLICIDFIFCRNKASRFNSAIGSANAYILASDITKKKILIQAYFISLLPVLICFFYGNIATIDYFCMFPGFLLYSMELAAIDSICRGTSNFTSSHTTNFAALINGNPIVDCYSTILVKFYRGLVIRNSISSDIHICQFSSLICIDFIFCRNKASRFNSAIGSANAYILASDITKKKILIQAYFICLLTILISFFYGNVTAVYYFRMLRRFCSCAICLIFDQFKLFFRCRSASRCKILTV